MGRPWNGQGSPDTSYGNVWEEPKPENTDPKTIGEVIRKRIAARNDAFQSPVRKRERI